MVSVRAVIGAALLAVSLTGGSQGAAAQSAPEPTHHGVAFIRDALSEAAAFGDRSLIASVVENARLTPQRSGAIADAAIALRPDLAASIERAISAGRNLADTWPAASVSLQAGQSAGAPPAAPFANPTPYPGGNPDIPITSLSEFDRNFSLDAIGAETALSLGFTGKGVVVGTIDTGIDIRPDGTMHPELLGRIDPRSKSYLYWFDESRLDDDDDDDFDGDDDGDGDDDDDTLAALSDAFDQGPTDSQDRDGHGTHVAGIIAAGQNGFGMQGVAPGANVIALKAITRNGRIEIDDDEYISFTNIETCGPSLFDGDCDKLYDSSAYPDAESAAFAYLAQFSDVRVINGSFGPATPDGTVTWDLGGAGEQAAILRQAQVVRGNLDAGQIVVMSAGNDRFYSPEAAQSPNGVGLYPFIRPENANATNVSGTQVYDDHGTGLDLSFTSAEALAAAEAADGKARGRIVVVVALDAYNELALYSEECGVTAEWCVAAPGGGVDGYGFPPPEGGRGIYSTVPEDSYGFKSGTSMAAPNVAGAIAVLIEAYPTFTPAEIVHILFTTAEDLGAPGVDPIFGWGLVRLDRALSVGPVGMSGTGTYTVGAGGSDTTWLVDFTSQGGLEKTGAGTLTVASAATFQKASTVSGGTLSVGGTLTTPSLSVDQGATLSGTGSVAADITVAGRLAPGNSPGTLLVTG
ncbi:S8 family serine peptidase, partial [Amorphus coralli]|uniref:S8 family serine peptidase n=1 Tax=Amorphus coralli TaxID=340680 RepID=UPI00037A32A2